MKQNSISKAIATSDVPVGGGVAPALKISLPEKEKDLKPRILVIGVGGGGCNAINNMVDAKLQGVEFIAANTDAQALESCKADYCIQLGPELTKGLGAGSKPDVGRAAAEEVAEEITKHLESGHMAFITAGMGGGTGTGAAPVFARIARDLGLLSVAIVTKPFDFEGRHRSYLADQGIDEVHPYVDTLVVVPNQNLFRVAGKDTSFCEAFAMADKVLYNGIKSVSSLMVSPGIVNLDFADVRSVMEHMGKARIGTGEAEGESRSIQAVEAAIANPLLSDSSMQGARAVLVNVTGGRTKLVEVQEIVNRVRQECGGNAHLVFGTGEDEALGGKIRVSLIAAGLEDGIHPSKPAHKGDEDREESLNGTSADADGNDTDHEERPGAMSASSFFHGLLGKVKQRLSAKDTAEDAAEDPVEDIPGEFNRLSPMESSEEPHEESPDEFSDESEAEPPSEPPPQPEVEPPPMPKAEDEATMPRMPSALFGNGKNGGDKGGEDNLEIPAFLRRGVN